jgi:hypothetical protein
MTYILIEKNGLVNISYTITKLAKWLARGLPLYKLDLIPIWILKKGTNLIPLFCRSSNLVTLLLDLVKSLLYLSRSTIWSLLLYTKCLQHMSNYCEPTPEQQAPSRRFVYDSNVSPKGSKCNSPTSNVNVVCRDKIKHNECNLCSHLELLFHSGQMHHQGHTLSRHNLQKNKNIKV